MYGSFHSENASKTVIYKVKEKKETGALGYRIIYRKMQNQSNSSVCVEELKFKIITTTSWCIMG